jgi:hypothetical protein
MSDNNTPTTPAPETLPPEESEPGPGIIPALAELPPGTLITERGLAEIFGKCTASIKAAVDRNELPPPVRLMGRRTWTAGAILRHHESRLEAEARKFARLRA